jgi:hypothetical protein
LEAAMLSLREVTGFLILMLFVYLIGTSKHAQHELDQIIDLIRLWQYKAFG